MRYWLGTKINGKVVAVVRGDHMHPDSFEVLSDSNPTWTSSSDLWALTQTEPLFAPTDEVTALAHVVRIRAALDQPVSA